MTYTPTTISDIIGADSEEEALARQQIERQLEITLVRQWVESLPDGSIVGIAGYGCGCPIANYLAAVSANPAFSFWIEPDFTSVNENGYQFICVRHPAWIATFVFKIDCLGSLSEITKEAALSLLDQIKEGAS